MATTPERRRLTRLPVPIRFSGLGLEARPVRILDLSPAGARVEHRCPLPDWSVAFVDLPPALGGLRLQGEVVWSQEAGRQEGAEEQSVLYYQSGLRFTLLTVGQRAGLTDALQILTAAQED